CLLRSHGVENCESVLTPLLEGRRLRHGMVRQSDPTPVVADDASELAQPVDESAQRLAVVVRIHRDRDPADEHEIERSIAAHFICDPGVAAACVACLGPHLTLCVAGWRSAVPYAEGVEHRSPGLPRKRLPWAAARHRLSTGLVPHLSLIVFDLVPLQ